MDRTVVKVTSQPDFLALVPMLSGFLPRNSLLLVAFRGPRTCGVMRFDLPVRQAAAVNRRLALTMVGMLCKVPAADAVVPVVFTDRPIGDDGLPHAAIAHAVIRRAELSGFIVRDALCQAADGWACYLDAEPVRRPLEQINASAVHRALPAGSRPHLTDIAAAAELPVADRARRARVGAELRERPADVAGGGAAIDQLDQLLGADPEGIDAEAAARALEILQVPLLRDCVLLQFAFGGDIGRKLLEAGARSEADGGRAALTGPVRRLLGEGPRPDVERVTRAIALVGELAALAPNKQSAAPLVMLAWLNWALGRGTAAGLLLGRALRVDPEHVLANLLQTLFGSGLMPEWAFTASVNDP